MSSNNHAHSTYPDRVLNSLGLHPLDPIALNLLIRSTVLLDSQLHLGDDDTPCFGWVWISDGLDGISMNVNVRKSPRGQSVWM